jgi:hypothetical protein
VENHLSELGVSAVKHQPIERFYRRGAEDGSWKEVGGKWKGAVNVEVKVNGRMRIRMKMKKIRISDFEK